MKAEEKDRLRRTSSMWGGINRRKFPRADYQCLITIGKKGGERHFLTHTENIGVGGICVILDEDLGLFSEVEIELMLKDNGPPIKCRGNIVWVIKRTQIENMKSVPKFDTGVEFIDISEVNKTRIEKIVDFIIEMESKKQEGV